LAYNCGMGIVIALMVATTVLILALLALVWFSFRLMFRSRPRTADWILASSLESGDVKPAWLDLPWMEAFVVADGGYRLALHALAGRTNHTAIFHHGHNWCWYGMLRYMEPFIAAGWNVVAFDSRGHGRSEGGPASFGYFEKQDLRRMVDWVWQVFPKVDFLLTYGESMGGASVLQHAAIDDRVGAVVADCPYVSVRAELDHQLALYRLPRLVRGLVVQLVEILVRWLDGYSFFEADPMAAIMRTPVPILFIHGQEDRYVPWRFSVAMQAKRQGFAPTELLLVPGARHAKSRQVDPVLYDRTVADFVTRCLAASAGSVPGTRTDGLQAAVDLKPLIGG